MFLRACVNQRSRPAIVWLCESLEESLQIVHSHHPSLIFQFWILIRRQNFPEESHPFAGAKEDYSSAPRPVIRKNVHLHDERQHRGFRRVFPGGVPRWGTLLSPPIAHLA